MSKYEWALTAACEDTQAWWADLLARKTDELEEGADVEGLRGFLGLVENRSRNYRTGH